MKPQKKINEVTKETVLFEQLALKRLRHLWELELKEAGRVLWNAFVKPTPLHRIVGPDQRPLERHEWERTDNSSLR